MQSTNKNKDGKPSTIHFTIIVLFAISSYCEGFNTAHCRKGIIRRNLSIFMSSTQPRKRMLAERTHVRRRHETEEAPKYRAKNRAEERFTSSYLMYEKTKYPHLGMEDEETVLVSKAKKPSKAEKEELSEKIARLLNSDLDYSSPCTGEEIADKETVFANLSEEDRREAVNAVSSLKSKEQVDPEARIRSPSKKGKVKANVMETGKDSIKEYMKSLSEHQVLSAHDEKVLGKQVQILTKWEEKRQELEVSLSRYVTLNCPLKYNFLQF